MDNPYWDDFHLRRAGCTCDPACWHDDDECPLHGIGGTMRLAEGVASVPVRAMDLIWRISQGREQ